MDYILGILLATVIFLFYLLLLAIVDKIFKDKISIFDLTLASAMTLQAIHLHSGSFAFALIVIAYIVIIIRAYSEIKMAVAIQRQKTEDLAINSNTIDLYNISRIGCIISLVLSMGYVYLMVFIH